MNAATTQFESPLLDMDQAAAYCRYGNKKRFGQWVKRNKVPYELRGKAKFFYRDLLEKHLRKVQKPFGE